ncbi:DNA-binding NarL/FixJ family response regulator [Nocardia tenerifensis]|uniref:DNA-binding NarL/FixJ family response regulator n=1 Tax=Nocardia tenerifensis TaxID=228006 RepID=A0A318KB66_9NOCA|nr:response regulator transcription factor [Nocardia tenerifensis]PXX62289.1 DNA-binding NarL/FixJ family response regulator [Nocardia tenerifensis]
MTMNPAEAPLRILLADPDPISRHVLSGLLDLTGEVDLRCSLDSRTPAREWPVHGIDVAVLCIDADEDLYPQVAALAGKGIRVIVLGAHWNRARLDAAFGFGAMGCLIKTPDPANLILGVRAVSGDHCVLSPELLGMYVAPRGSRAKTDLSLQERALDSLTKREREVLDLIANGASTEDVAARLTVSVSTVKSHVSRALGKLDVRNRLEAVLLMQHAAKSTRASHGPARVPQR